MNSFKKGVDGLIAIIFPWLVFILFVSFMALLPSCFGPLEAIF